LRGALDAELSRGRRQIRCLRSCQQLHHRANSDKLCQGEASRLPLFGVPLEGLIRGLKLRAQLLVTRGRAEHLDEHSPYAAARESEARFGTCERWQQRISLPKARDDRSQHVGLGAEVVIQTAL